MNTEKIKSAAEYIKEVSQKTVTPIINYKLCDDSVIMLYDNYESKQKADDHGTTELLREMFLKYLSGTVGETPSISFDIFR